MVNGEFNDAQVVHPTFTFSSRFCLKPISSSAVNPRKLRKNSILAVSPSSKSTMLTTISKKN
ncbi:unnamed protein product, partial [Nesidiocoris tenuis]